MIYTTLNKIKAASPYHNGWNKLLAALGKTEPDDEPVSFAFIVKSNGLDYALLVCHSAPEHNALWRHFAVDCAESVRHLMKDERSTAALDVARRHANGEATDSELAAAASSAYASASAFAASSSSSAAHAAHAAAASSAYAAAAHAAAKSAMKSRFLHIVTHGKWEPCTDAKAMK